jgi:hypothetical protein
LWQYSFNVSYTPHAPVSILKAGARLVGYDAGPVWPPFTGLQENETEEPGALINSPEAQ